MVSFRLQTFHIYQIHSSLCVYVPLVNMTALNYELFQATFSAMITALHIIPCAYKQKTNHTATFPCSLFCHQN
jgi:hypothetical protein